MKNALLIILFTFINFIAWSYYGIFFLVNCVILFYFLDHLKDKKWHYAYLIGLVLFLLFNVSATFWLIRVDAYYSIYAFLANSFLMLIPFIFAVYISKRTKKYPVIFIFCWVFLEWLFTNWDLAWPWLNFGNVLSNQWYLIKWYFLFGVYSGSLWMLFAGYLIYLMLLKKNIYKNAIALILLSMLPLISIVSYTISKKTADNKIKILTYCPPFDAKKQETNYKKTRNLYQYIISHKTPDIIMTPELFYVDLYPNQLKNGDFSYFYKKVFVSKTKMVFFVGTEIDNSEKIKFNGISVISKDTILFRTKKKYVPVTEYTTRILRPIFGETYYSKNSIDSYEKIKNDNKIVPFVCYESLFSSFFAKNTTNTKVIFLSTSESFLKKSDFAKKQYLNIIRIRAIESGRYIVKCSNDGISCVINPDGKIIKHLNNEFESIAVPESNTNTFYQKIISFF